MAAKKISPTIQNVKARRIREIIVFDSAPKSYRVTQVYSLIVEKVFRRCFGEL